MIWGSLYRKIYNVQEVFIVRDPMLSRSVEFVLDTETGYSFKPESSMSNNLLTFLLSLYNTQCATLQCNFANSYCCE